MLKNASRPIIPAISLMIADKSGISRFTFAKHLPSIKIPLKCLSICKQFKQFGENRMVCRFGNAKLKFSQF